MDLCRSLRTLALALAFGGGLAGVAAAQDLTEIWQDHLKKGATAYGLAQMDVAAREIEAALALAEQNFPADDPKMITMWLNMLPLRRAQGRHDEAAAYGEKAVAAITKLDGAESSQLLSPLVVLGNNYRDGKRYDLADATYQRAIALHDKYFGDAHPRTVTLLEDRASTLLLAGKTDQALELWSELVDLWEYSLGPNNVREAMSRHAYAEALRAAGRDREAVTQDDFAAQIQRAWDLGR